MGEERREERRKGGGQRCKEMTKGAHVKDRPASLTQPSAPYTNYARDPFSPTLDTKLKSYHFLIDNEGKVDEGR